ncbi:interleukin-1 family member 10-like [Eublepharis macularius]|uniref:Interleukin-1 n=1 Tax=Eublepharis macularius TaxID=481883 RepID=A0AA97KAH7_EUBMA|nr:interleukin-1 family member 10-like [Eublepharis macularius]
MQEEEADLLAKEISEPLLPPPFLLPPPQLPPPGTLTTTRPEVLFAAIEPRSYSLRDIDHKSLYLQDNNLMVAFLQGDDNSAQEEALSVLPNRSLDRKRFPLILGVKGGSQGISCGNEDEPKLQLEDTDFIYLFTNGEEAKRFTFFKSYNGSTHTFESATHPGWYLSSSAETHKPLMLTSHLGGAVITDFYFDRK